MPQPRNSGILLGRIFGIPIYLHTSWFIIFALITFSLRAQFVVQHPGWSPAQYWTLGIITSLLFFASVVFHELCHSVVAMNYRIPVQSITLFVFGGVSRIEREAATARQEFNIAIVGPLSSLVLAGSFWLVSKYAQGGPMVGLVTHWLAQINLVLALFNLVPGFPLDGGRVLRGVAWGVTRNYMRATQIASTAGKIFAYFLIIVGVWQALSGLVVNGVWLAFIGWFLLEAARESYAQVAIRSTLTGVRAVDIMSRDIPTVPSGMTLEEYMHEVLRSGRRCHVVVSAGTPVGLVTLASARAVPREEWHTTSVQSVMIPPDRIHSADPSEEAMKILERMQAEDVNQMPVISQGQIVGMISRDTILRVLQTRLQAGHLAES